MQKKSHKEKNAQVLFFTRVKDAKDQELIPAF